MSDTENPVITLTGDAEISVIQGSTYTEQGAIWADNKDGAGSATVSGSVDTSVVGTYTISYDYTDAAGNVATTVARTVNVVEVSDRDGDGTPDSEDDFPDDPTEDTDTDGDGVGDNKDSHPDDPRFNDVDTNSILYKIGLAIKSSNSTSSGSVSALDNRVTALETEIDGGTYS